MYRTTNRPNTRIEVADALRGIAVAGIILFHAREHFNLYWSALDLPRAGNQKVDAPSGTANLLLPWPTRWDSCFRARCTPSSHCCSG